MSLHLRFLFQQRNQSDQDSIQRRDYRHVCGGIGRLHYLSGRILRRDTTGRGSEPYLYHTAQCIPAGIQRSTDIGYIFSVMFYVLLAMAALTSTISLHEVVTAYLHEEFNFTRGKAARLVTGGCIFLGILCSLSLGVMKGFTIFGLGIFDLFDFVTAKIMLTLGGLCISIFTGWYLDKKIVWSEITNDGSLKVPVYKLIIFILRYIAPIAISLIFINELGLIKL